MSQVGGALVTAQRIHQDPEDTSQQAVFTVQGGACLGGGGWGAWPNPSREISGLKVPRVFQMT